MKANAVFTGFLLYFLSTFLIFSLAQKSSMSVNNSVDDPIRADSCGSDLVLVIKKGNLEPACLEPLVANKLLSVSWGTVPPEASANILRVGQVLPNNCVEGLVVIVKNTNSKPACVTPETALKLVLRGWGVIPNS